MKTWLIRYHRLITNCSLMLLFVAVFGNRFYPHTFNFHVMEWVGGIVFVTLIPLEFFAIVEKHEQYILGRIDAHTKLPRLTMAIWNYAQHGQASDDEFLALLNEYAETAKKLCSH
jgi:hypothetical protein